MHYKSYGAPSKKGLSDAQYEDLKQQNKAEYRQHLGETATVKLSEYLRTVKGSGDEVPCTFETANIQKPSDVCDVYGRFVGDIFVKVNGRKVDVNKWLLSEGWVFPAFYDSMLPPEINDLLDKWSDGKKKKARLWSYYTPVIGAFDYSLQYRAHGVPDEKADKGDVIIPKLFRRFCIYSIYRKANIDKGTFKDYLKSADKTDKLVLMKDFKDYLKAKKDSPKGHEADVFLKTLSQYFDGKKFLKAPADMIFVEKPSMLVDDKGNEIKKWG